MLIFVLGHYLLLEAHSFPRASLSENCSLLGTDNVHGQKSEHIFVPDFHTLRAESPSIFLDKSGRDNLQHCVGDFARLPVAQFTIIINEVMSCECP